LQKTGFPVILGAMPITSSAKKALRASKNKRVFNLNRKDEMHQVMKDYKKLVAEKKTAEAVKLLPKLQKAIDKAAKGGLIKKGNASRKKSRLMKKLSTKTA
jgi:small subunit ribosomal protein S20